MALMFGVFPCGITRKIHLLAKTIHSQWTQIKRFLMLARDLEKPLYFHIYANYISRLDQMNEAEIECKRLSVMISVRCPLDSIRCSVSFH